MPADPGGGQGAAPGDAAKAAGTALGESSAAGAPIGEAATTAGGRSHLVRYLAVYSALRVGLVVVLTAVLAFFMPLIVALLFAIIVQLPLAWLLFAGPRRRVNDAMAQASAQRRAERARLQSALTGDVDPS
jgi:Flp pilus assembly protein TadB